MVCNGNIAKLCGKLGSQFHSRLSGRIRSSFQCLTLQGLHICGVQKLFGMFSQPVCFRINFLILNCTTWPCSFFLQNFMFIWKPYASWKIGARLAGFACFPQDYTIYFREASQLILYWAQKYLTELLSWESGKHGIFIDKSRSYFLIFSITISFHMLHVGWRHTETGNSLSFYWTRGQFFFANSQGYQFQSC